MVVSFRDCRHLVRGIPPQLISRKILNHVESGVTKVYDRHSYDKEKQEALNAWGMRLSRIVSGLELVKAEDIKSFNAILMKNDP